MQIYLYTVPLFRNKAIHNASQSITYKTEIHENRANKKEEIIIIIIIT